MRGRELRYLEEDGGLQLGDVVFGHLWGPLGTDLVQECEPRVQIDSFIHSLTCLINIYP
jgi:hypothetical protein